MKKLNFVMIVLALLQYSHISFAQKIDTNSKEISILEEVILGDFKQWIQIKGRNASNPILLFLHGGPGFSQMPYSHKDSKLLEEHFIVVNWDQLGAGKSYNDKISLKDMTVERVLDDTHELIQILKKRFNKEKIFLIGHSWGSCLGLYTAINHPEDIFAYIGMGQAIDLLQGEIDGYHYTLQKVIEQGDTVDIKTLKDIGLPPFEGGFQSLIKQRAILGKYGGAFNSLSYSEIEEIRKSSPVYTNTDHENYMKGFGFSQYCLWDQVMKVNFFKETTNLKVPVYFFEGRHDYGTPFALVEEYFKIVNAPYKEIIWFENSGHFLNLEEPQKYQKQLIDIAAKHSFATLN